MATAMQKANSDPIKKKKKKFRVVGFGEHYGPKLRSTGIMGVTLTKQGDESWRRHIDEMYQKPQMFFGFCHTEHTKKGGGEGGARATDSRAAGGYAGMVRPSRRSLRSVGAPNLRGGPSTSSSFFERREESADEEEEEDGHGAVIHHHSGWERDDPSGEPSSALEYDNGDRRREQEYKWVALGSDEAPAELAFLKHLKKHPILGVEADDQANRRSFLMNPLPLGLTLKHIA